MRVELFIDPVSGWSWWTPALLVEDEPQPDQERAEARLRPAGQGLVVRLLGRVGAWFGVCEQTPSGAWQRVHVGPAGIQGSRTPRAVTASSGAGGAGDRPSSRPVVEPGPGM
jgi:hypothetical protein